MITSPNAASSTAPGDFHRMVAPSTVDWAKIGRELPHLFAHSSIKLIPSEQTPKAETLHNLFPDAERIFAVDFYVSGAEIGPLLAGESGHRATPRIFNIDHHSPDPRWERHISSGNLACRWVRANGPIDPKKDVIIVNHTDCDSVLAALVLCGALPPVTRIEEAVLDADHRGLPNPISDLLQATSTNRDLKAAVEALSRELQGLPAIGAAKVALDDLQEKRLLAKNLVKTGTEIKDGVALVKCPTYIDSDLFLNELPNAVAIVIGCRSKKFPEVELTRLRLGNAAPEGLSLHRLGAAELDPYFGGRFNAGSNKRGLERALLSGEKPVIVSSVAHAESLRRRINGLK